MLTRLNSLFDRIERNRRIRETIKELNMLTDSELKDIGISRANIRSIAMESEFDNTGGRV